jgi:hypothetical protein
MCLVGPLLQEGCSVLNKRCLSRKYLWLDSECGVGGSFRGLIDFFQYGQRLMCKSGEHLAMWK